MRRLAKKVIYSLTILLFLSGEALAAGTNAVSVSATVLSKSICLFNSATSTLNFGSLDPANPVNVTTSTTIIFRCVGSAPLATFFISDDDGLYETGPDANRMGHTVLPAQFLPYSLTLSPTTATVPRLTNQTLTVTGTVLGVDYQAAYPGSYSDTVIITIVP